MVKDWRVLYGSYDGEGSHTRSKPFNTEDQALAWAITWLKGQDVAIGPAAHVMHRAGGGLDPTPREHRIQWLTVDGQQRLVKQTWPSKSLQEHEAELRQVLAGLGQPDGQKVHTDIELIEEMPLRAL